MNFKQHALSAIFPPMSDDEYDALVDDIAANGQREAITVFEGSVIDGWHRYRACTQLGIGVLSKQFDGDADPVAFVLSRNLHRRHLSASQRAMAVASCASWMPEGRPKNPAPGAEFPAGPAPKTIADLAHDAGVGQRTMERAARVAKEATPEVAHAVAQGSLGMKRAADIAGLPQDEQAAAISAPAPSAPKAAKRAPAAPADDELQAKVAAQADQIEELARTVRELLDENTAMAAVFDTDEKLAEAMKQNKQLRALLGTANERVNGLMFEKQEMTAEVTKLQRQVARLKKSEVAA